MLEIDEHQVVAMVAMATIYAHRGDLAPALTVARRAHVVAPNTPWVAVVIPDGALSERRELTGSENPHVVGGHHPAPFQNL